MSGLNSLGGLNNVNVDFRPTVELNATKKDGTAPQQPVVPVAPENAPQPPKAEAKSVVRHVEDGRDREDPQRARRGTWRQDA